MLEPLVARHQGRVFKVTGDGVLVEFASAVNAVQCAVELQHAMLTANGNLQEDHHIVLRIGVNLGDVMVKGGDLYGEGVNIAARLEAIAEPGEVVISGTAHDHVGSKVKVAFEDLGNQPLKNIAEPVRAFRVTGTPAIAVAKFKPVTDKPSIAVLPFTNMSSDPEQDYFADGLSEDLITALSKVPGLFVIARHSTFVYKGKSIDVRRVARELGVGHVVEGSVRRVAKRLRITVQLIDAVAGGHVWADRFDRDLEDIFAIQDEVSEKIVNAFATALPSVHRQPKRRTPKIEAYDLFVRGRVLTEQTVDTTKLGRPLLERAIKIDPDFAEAHAWLAMNLTFQWVDWGKADDRDRILAAADRAVSLDPDNSDGHFVRGYALTYQGNLTGGRAEFELALKSNPNHADAWVYFADLEVFDGHPDEAIRAVEKAFRLNPYPNANYYWLMGFALYAAHRYEEAVGTLEHELCRGTGSQRVLAAALAQLGTLDDAREVARLFMISQPNFTVSGWAKTQPFRDLRDLEHLVDGYIKAGLPD